MKGLIFREFYLSRKYFMLSLGIFLLTALMSILTRLSMMYGNLSHVSDDTIFKIDQNSSIILTALPCIVIFISFCIDGGVIFSDYNSGWFKYCFTTPCSERKTAAVKFICRIIALTAAFLLSFIYMTIICGLGGKTLSLMIFKSLSFLFVLAAVVSSLYITLSIRCKNKNTVAVTMFGAAMVIYIPTVMYFFNHMKIQQNDDVKSFVMQTFESIINTTFPLSFFISAASFALGYYFSVQYLKRRDN